MSDPRTDLTTVQPAKMVGARAPLIDGVEKVTGRRRDHRRREVPHRRVQGHQ